VSSFGLQHTSDKAADLLFPCSPLGTRAKIISLQVVQKLCESIGILAHAGASQRLWGDIGLSFDGFRKDSRLNGSSHVGFPVMVAISEPACVRHGSDRLIECAIPHEMEVILRPKETVQPLRKIGHRFATVAIPVISQAGSGYEVSVQSSERFYRSMQSRKNTTYIVRPALRSNHLLRLL
jgi:hypothetical protein